MEPLGGLNRQPPPYQVSALPLSYMGIKEGADFKHSGGGRWTITPVDGCGHPPLVCTIKRSQAPPREGA